MWVIYYRVIMGHKVFQDTLEDPEILLVSQFLNDKAIGLNLISPKGIQGVSGAIGLPGLPGPPGAVLYSQASGLPT